VVHESLSDQWKSGTGFGQYAFIVINHFYLQSRYAFMVMQFTSLNHRYEPMKVLIGYIVDKYNGVIATESFVTNDKDNRTKL